MWFIKNNNFKIANTEALEKKLYFVGRGRNVNTIKKA